ncbi:MAG: peptidase dimerization protein [Leptothrix sp. (in: Bacteria)]|nr:peptidase dimerization protein [Leptothrix sp. (in: b-proteobacteria)]
MRPAAAVPCDSIVVLLRDLVRIPSRAVEDDLAPVLGCMAGWLRDRGLTFQALRGPGGEPLGLYAEVQGSAGAGPWTVLDATLDTAGFGNPASWARPPTSAAVADGWLHGRGSADSKAGVALFAHLLHEFAAAPAAFAGRLGVLFDLDEHSGGFGGARAFFDHPFEGGPPPRPDGVIIGYPGMERIVTGGRGFLRARLAVHGVAAHSGASRQRGVNAIDRALALARVLAAARLPAGGETFPLPPQLTWTGIHGGGDGFSQVPDLCELRLDLRLTPAFDAAAARALVESAVRDADAGRGAAPATAVTWHAGWPAYQVADTHPLVTALREAARTELALDLPTVVVGPSNIGNYLASLGVPALCGFGVQYRHIHAADEAVALDSIAPVYRIYRHALQALQRG